MISFLNFDAKQLQETDGFRKKVEKVASNISIKKLLYFEIINIEASSLDVLMIDSQMYFHKVHLYSEKAIKMLNSEFGKLVSSLGISKEDVLDTTKTIDDCNLIDQIQSLISRIIQLLNIENSYDLDKMDKVSSSEFNVNLTNFTYSDLSQIMKPFVKNFIPSTYNFKILSLDKISIEILAITEDCRLYQYTIFLDSCYTRFLNRYLSAILPNEKFIEMKRNLKSKNFFKALEATLPSYSSKNKKLDTCGFLAFLINKYQKDRKDEGYAGEGLKNVYKFFLDTSKDEEDAKKKVLKYFIEATTYDKKKM